MQAAVVPLASIAFSSAAVPLSLPLKIEFGCAQRKYRQGPAVPLVRRRRAEVPPVLPLKTTFGVTQRKYRCGAAVPLVRFLKTGGSAARSTA